MHYQKYCFIKSHLTTFNDIVNAIEKTGIGSVIIVDHLYKLQGIATDGDIRKCVLQNTLNVDALINITPEVWPITKSKRSAINHLKKIHRNILPIINEQRIVVDIISLSELNFNLINNHVILMAGGLGTRLMPLTKDTPKPLLPIKGKPILERIIEKLIEQGFQNFYISINYQGNKIKDYFGDGSQWDIDIKYIEEDKRLGTAGALHKLKHLLKEPFIVMNADIITDLNFRKLLKQNIDKNNLATMCVYKQIHQIPFGVVKFDSMHNISSLVEKPQQEYYINMGIYALNPAISQYIPDNTFFDMPTLFQKVIDDSKYCDVYQFDGLWNDIGRIEDYEAINILDEK